MGDRIDSTLYGWLVFDEAFGGDYLATNDAGTTGSDYAQTVPRPGVPEITAGTDSAVVQASGTQAESIDVRITQSGMPGRKGARVALRGEDDVWLGWTETQVEQFECIDAPVLQTYVQVDVAASMTTGLAIAGRMGSSDSIWAGFYHDGDDTWTAATGETADATEGLALVGLPSGRMLAICYDGTQVNVDYSDDGGATWSAYAKNALQSSTLPNTTSMCTAAYSDGEISLIFQRDGASGDLYQLASDDLGVTFKTVKSHVALGTMPSVFAMPGSGFGVAYQKISGSQPCFARLGSAFVSLDDVEEVDVGSSTGVTSIAGYATDAGMLYINGVGGGLARSFDLGATWIAPSLTWLGALGTASPLRNARAAWTGKGALIAVQWTPAVSTGVNDDGLAVMWLGGWTNRERAHEPREPDAAASQTGGYSTFGDGSQSGVWLAGDTLENSGWSKSGTGSEALGCGVVTITGIIALASPEGRHQPVDEVYDFIDCSCHDGGAVTGNNQYFSIIIEDSPDSFQYKLRVATGGWRLVDTHNSDALLVAGTVDMTEGRQFFIGKNVIWHRARGSRTWTRETFSSTNGTYTGDYTLSYEGTQSLSEVRVRMLGRQPEADSIGYSAAVQTGISGYTGRPIGSDPVWHPFGSGGKIALIDGPATTGTEWTVDPVHDYGAQNAMPDKGPSPLREWRSGVETEQIICWDLGEERRQRWIGIYTERPRFRTAFLEWYDGSTWNTEISLDAAEGWTALDYEREGGTVMPTSTAGADAGRYMQSGEMVGGYVIFSSGECRTIAANTAGAWGPASSGSPRPTLLLEDIDGSEPTTGTIVIVPPRALAVGYVAAVSPEAQYWRLRIDAQDAPGGSIGAGLILVGALHLAGAEPDWGWGEEVSLSVDRTVSAQGTPRASEIGPPRRTWSWSWTEGVDLTQLRTTLNVDYLRPDTASAASLVADQDVWWQLTGLMTMTKSGTLPVVAIRGVPDEGETVNDPTRMLYGYVDGGPSVTGMAGTEGVDEAVRLGTITTREIK